MKKWFFMLICMVAYVLPQNVWAQTINVSGNTATNGTTIATLDGTTLTVTCNATSSGELGKVGETVRALLTTPEDKAAITEIKFVGNITEADMVALKAATDGDNGGFANVTKVDMGDAHIVASASGMTATSWTFYKATTSEGITTTPGTTAVFGGTLKQYVATKAWTSASEQWTDLEYATQAAMEATSPVVGTVAKVPSYMYCQLQVTGGSWKAPVTANPGNVVKQIDNESTDEITNYINNSSNLALYENGQSISFIRYFKKIEAENQWGGEWVDCSKTDYYNIAHDDNDGTTTYPNMTGVELDNLLNDRGNVGDGMWTYVFYTKQDTRSWTVGTTMAPTGVTIKEASFLYSDRNNHKDEYSNNDWVRMNNGFTYWKYIITGTGSWVAVSPQPTSMEGVTIYSASGDPATGTDGQYAIVEGTEFFYTGSVWKSLSEVQMVAAFNTMKFSYWSDKLTTAITSRFADANISNEIFQNCKKITRIDFLGGHVKGLNSRTTGENNYADFTLFVGKDVTEIASAALNGSDALTKLEFDEAYTADEKKIGSGYPKELIIRDYAFNECHYLKEVEIPNRCISIGEQAFYRVGNQDDNNINGAKIDGRTFTLDFERRHYDDGGDEVGINCDYPLTIGKSAFLDCFYLKELSLPIRLESLGGDCFKNTVSLHTLEMREKTNAPYTPPTGHDLLRTIPTGAFEGSRVSMLKIPKCVTLIEDKAFGFTTNLSRIDFQTNNENPVRPLVIKSGAFAGGTETERPQLDIYINVNPDERMIICEYGAFNRTQTAGQTNVANTEPSFSFLHFDEEYWDYYQGDWKRGLAFRQENLNSMLEGYTGPHGQNTTVNCAGKGTEMNLALGKYTKADTDQDLVAPANGWQEFARTKTNIDIDLPSGTYLRTYSTKKPQVIPTFTENITINNVQHKKGDPMFKIYRITNFNDNYGTEVSPKASATEIVAKVSGRNYIPPVTGVIMAADFGAHSYVAYLSDITVGSPVTFPYNETVGTADVMEQANLLYPTCIDDQFTRPSGWPAQAKTPEVVSVDDGTAVKLYSTIPCPYHATQAPLQYRLFGLSSSSEGSFNRLKNGVLVSRDKAYLKLSKEMFRIEAEGANGGGGSGVNPTTGATNAPIMLSFQDPEGNTTDVRMINPATMTIMEDSYYTLQGMKLNARPTQPGIYIHNGKKVVIK